MIWIHETIKYNLIMLQSDGIYVPELREFALWSDGMILHLVSHAAHSIAMAISQVGH